MTPPPARGMQTAVTPQAPGAPNPAGPNQVVVVGTSQTGQDMQNEANALFGVEDGGWARLLAMFNGDVERAEAYLQQLINEQATELAQGVQTREGPMMQCANYMAFDHQSLDGMVKQNADPGAVGSTGDQWIRAGNAMARFQTGVISAIGKSSSDWTGSSGDQARGFMADVGNWVGEAGKSAQLAGTQMNAQAQALSKAKNEMPAEVPYDQGEWIQKIFTSGDPWGTWEQAKAQYKAHQEAHQEAARVVATYDAGLAGASTMPAFSAPPTMAGGGGEPPKPPPTRVGPFPPDGGGPGPGGGPGGGPGSLTPPPGGGGTGTLPRPPGGGAGGPGSGLPGGPGYPGGTLPGGATPGRPGGPGGSGGSGGPGSGQGGDGGFPIGGMPIGGFPGGSDYDRGPGGRGGTGPGGGRGFGPGGSGGTGFGADSSGRSGGMGRGPGAGGMGPGGAGALAAEHAAGGGGRGGLGGGGRGGAGGMPMGGMGGGRGQGDDDGEHQRPSYLVEGDPESVFGTDEMTAPPVIGE